ncbi:MAG: methyl-accepting chemotaxis protein [Phycisphaerales bacterium]
MLKSVATKLIVSVGVGLVALLLVTGVSLWVFSETRALEAAKSELSDAMRNHLEGDMMHDALRGDVLAAMLATTEQELSDARKELGEHAEWFRKVLKQNEELALTDSIRKELASVRPALDQYIGSAVSVTERVRVGSGERPAELESFTRAYGELEEKMEKVSDLIGAELDAKHAAVASRASSAVTLIGGVAIGGLVLASIAAYATVTSISRPLRRTSAFLQLVAQGDLTKRLTEDSGDEFGGLARHCNQTVESISKIIQASRSVATQVEKISAEIDGSARASLDSARSQSQTLQQMSAAIEQMSSSITEAAGRSADAAKTAIESGKTAEESASAVSGMIAEMKTIEDGVRRSGEMVNELGARGAEIGRIIAVINDIAEQTNLLALNAAIEAARAGEHGRGFAVVADEVRKLADRTTGATAEVAKSIGAIQDQTKLAVEQMQQGREQVSRGAQRAGEAGTTLERIVSGSRQVASLIQSIAGGHGGADQRRPADRQRRLERGQDGGGGVRRRGACCEHDHEPEPAVADALERDQQVQAAVSRALARRATVMHAAAGVRGLSPARRPWSERS